jgi:4-hydroxy-3-methylbut-2-en-1-yl diphosphate synthase IspG/GcpE
LTNVAGAIDEYRSLTTRASADDPHAEIVEVRVTADTLPSWKTFISSLPERGPLAVNVGDDTRLALEIMSECDAILFRPSSEWNESEWTNRLAILVDAIASAEKKALVVDVNADDAPPFLAHPHSIDTVCAMAERVSSLLLERNFKNFCLRLSHNDLVYAARAVVSRLESRRFTTPLQVSWAPAGDEPALFYASTALGSLLCDGIGDAITVDDPNVRGTDAVRLGFNVLQATRLRISKTEFISCPSCGRTLFDLQEVTARIKSKTGHLKGVKIAIMGCIVNGPGEMADADFGYVGAAAGKINLYVGKELVERNIDMAIADERLIDLIRRKGMWVDAVETAKS